MPVYHHNYWNQFECRQCHIFGVYEKFPHKGYCTTRKSKVKANRPACKYFIPLDRCPICKIRPVAHDEILDICKVCRNDLQKEKEEAYI